MAVAHRPKWADGLWADGQGTGLGVLCTSPSHGLYVGDEEAADDGGDDVEGDPEEVGDVETVVPLLDAVVSPLSQQSVFVVSEDLNGDDDGAANERCENAYQQHDDPSLDILITKIIITCIASMYSHSLMGGYSSVSRLGGGE